MRKTTARLAIAVLLPTVALVAWADGSAQTRGKGGFFGMLERARTACQQQQSVANLRHIAIAVNAYAADNKARLPPRLGELAPFYVRDPAAFISPWATKRPAPPADPDKLGRDELSAWVEQNI